MQILDSPTHLLDRAFNIRSYEWPRVLLLFLISALSSVGFVWGTTITYAAFLSEQDGLEMLPLILILVAVLSIIASAIYAPFVDRMPDAKLHNIVFGIEVAGIIIGLFLIWQGRSTLAYPLLYLLALAVVAVVNPHQATYFNNFYNTQTAKRTLPIINAGYRVGGIIAGLTMGFLNVLFSNSPAAIVVMWLVTHVVMMGIVWLLPYILKEQGVQPEGIDYSPAAQPSKKALSYIDNVKEGFQYTTRSSYLLWMAVSTLLLMALLALLEYRSTEILLAEYHNDPAGFAAFLALLGAFASFFVVPILLFGISRIIGAMGLGNASLIFPVGNLAVCASLILKPGQFTAAAAYVTRTDFQLAFQFPIEGLLYNAVPARVKGRARAFVNGLLSPIGSLIGGLSLLFFVIFVPSLAWIITILIGVLAVAYLGSAFVVRKLYSRALIKMLEQENYSSLLLREGSELAIADPATLKLLQERLEESDDPQFTVFMANIISRMGGSDARKILVEAVRTSPDPDVCAGIIEVIMAGGLRGQEIEALYTDLLTDTNHKVRLTALMGLESIVGVDNKEFQALALTMLDDCELDTQAQILSILVHAKDFSEISEAVHILNRFLAEDDPEKRAYGIIVQGQLAYIQTSRTQKNVTRFVYPLTTRLTDSDDHVRLQAVLALEKLSENKLTDGLSELIVQQMSPLVKDPVERIRQATLVVYSRLSRQEANQILVDVLDDASPQVRTVAVEMMVQAGKAAIPIVHPLLDSPASSLRKTAAVILTRINKNEYGGLILSYITGNLLAVYKNYGFLAALTPYANYTSVLVLQDTLQERNQHLLDEIFYLLSALHGADSVKVILESFHSADPDMRANATEALESFTTPQTARLMSPFYDPHVDPAEVLVLSTETWEMEHPDSDQIIEILVNIDDSWLRAMIIFALGEMVAAQINVANAEEALPATAPLSTNEDDTLVVTDRSKRRRRPPTDLFSALEDEPETEEPAPSRRSRKRIDPLAMLAADEEKAEEEMPSPDSNAEVEEKTLPLEIEKINDLVTKALDDSDGEVRMAARSAQRMLAGLQIGDMHLTVHSAKQILTDTQSSAIINEEEFMLSTIEKVIFLKKVPFFQGMTIDQLRILADVCEEELFEKDAHIFDEQEPGGNLYVVISGKVAIEKEGRRKGSFMRLTTFDVHSYFGEMNLFDNSPHTNSAIALQDTLTLRLRREPLIALARQNPDMSLELINVLSYRLREANDQIVELTPAKPRELHKLFDQFD